MLLKETLDKNSDIMEPINFVNISTKRLINDTPNFAEISKFVARQYGYNLNVRIDRVITNKIIINCILNN